MTDAERFEAAAREWSEPAWVVISTRTTSLGMRLYAVTCAIPDVPAREWPSDAPLHWSVK